MAKIIETSLVIRKVSAFDTIRRSLLKMFYKNEYDLISRVDSLMTPKRKKIDNIVIPKEMKKF